MYGVPSGEKLEDYFSEASVHHKLISEGQVMVHANANIEYWTHADDNKKPVVDQLEWGKILFHFGHTGASRAFEGGKP